MKIPRDLSGQELIRKLRSLGYEPTRQSGTLSTDKKKMYVPVIRKDNKITDRSLVYVFDVDYYVFDKNAR